MVHSTDISGTFKVGSWLLSVDTHNREQLLKSCQGWAPEHTELLLLELEAQLLNSSQLGIDLVRTSRKKLIYASMSLEKYKNFSHAPISIGLTLIS